MHFDYYFTSLIGFFCSYIAYFQIFKFPNFIINFLCLIDCCSLLFTTKYLLTTHFTCFLCKEITKMYVGHYHLPLRIVIIV